ncbi:leukocyte receptor cluster member 1 [Alosa sapidissima]|uniref:leukocyte receptor cluster member 1 n=1 Tax=Alosa sapidissima TaxID=34773 RepID=UPI001C0841F5|nr:leukocyte receptor cluster member 1 [Alosa sapidissima]
MNILPKKSWHVRNKDNVARVRRDEAQAAEEEREIQKRIERAEQEARTQFLRNKSRGALGQSSGAAGEDGAPEGGEGTAAVELLNLFPLEDASGKKGNEEYLKEKKEEKEKQERAIGLLVSLGPAPGTAVTPWYLESRSEREKKKEEEEKDERGKKEKEKDKRKHRSFTAEEKEKRDRRLKDSLDPLAEMNKALAKKGHNEKKSRKRERQDRGGTSSGGQSTLERLRAERLQREAEEKRKAKALLEQKSVEGKQKEPERVVGERDRPYNSAYFPQLARKRQRRDHDHYDFSKPL